MIKLVIQISITMLIDLIDLISKIEQKMLILINNFTSIFLIKRICDRHRIIISINIKIRFIKLNQIINFVNLQKIINKSFSIHFQLFCQLHNNFFF